jgi:hypothetical protein
MIQTNDDFLLNVRRKIKSQKMRSSILTSTLVVILMIFASIQINTFIYQNRMENLWASYQPVDEYYEWELLDEITDDEVFEFLLQELEFDEFLYSFSSDERIVTWINTINIKG